MLEKPKLFSTVKEFWSVLLFLAVVVAVRLFSYYTEYQEFVSKRFYYCDVKVLQQYKKMKKNRTYTVLRVYSKELDLIFFTTTYRDESFLNKTLRLKLFPSRNIRFSEYLSSSFISSEINEITPRVQTFKQSLLDEIATQHSQEMITNFYQAIFLATPLQRELRQEVSKLGVSHLIALSGFHLGILSAVLFFLFRPLYSWGQRRYFPYRFDLIDIGFVVLITLGFYVWFVDSPASLLRSYVMMAVGWIVLILGVELLSFAFLATIVLFLLVIFPKMLFSLAFWFSVLGVFYIFLIIQRFRELNRYLMTLLISFGIFVLMMPIVHFIFPITSISQLYSPFLSLGFTIFYPLSMGLHILGIGGLFDDLLMELFMMQSEIRDVELPLSLTIAYLFLSLGAIYSRWLFYLLFFIAFGFMIWIFWI